MLKQTKNEKTYKLLAAIIIFSAMLIGCSKASNSNEKNAATNATPATSSSPSVADNKNSKPEDNSKVDETTKPSTDSQSSKSVIDIADLTSEYEKSKENTRKKYDGKEITVRGQAFVGPQMPRGSGDDTGLLSVSVKDDPIKDLKCWFSKADEEQFSKIKGDQFVTVKGIFDGNLFPELKFCKVVKIE